MGNAVTNPARFIEKKAFGVTNRDDSIFVNKDARCRFAHNVVAPIIAENSVPPNGLMTTPHAENFIKENIHKQFEKVGCKRP